MDPTKRQITKIAREVSSYTVHKMKDEGIGTAEFDFIHAVRHHPGITQSEPRSGHSPAAPVPATLYDDPSVSETDAGLAASEPGSHRPRQQPCAGDDPLHPYGSYLPY